jgi:hypothetical protein
MTKETLESDIELARKLLAAGRPDNEVTAALVGRGISEAKAAQVVQALGQGKQVTPEIVHVPLVRPGPGTKAPGAPPEPRNPQPDPLSRRVRRSGSNRPQAVPGNTRPRWWILALLALAAGGLALVLYLRHARNQERLAYLEAQTSHPPAVTVVDGKATKPLPMRVDLVLCQDGPLLSGQLLARSNTLEVLRQVFGAPARTNQLAPSGQASYAYDRQGILVYSRQGGGYESIVFDFEALGGPHGTEVPFTGSLQIEGTSIRSDTSTQSLQGIRSLGLTRSTVEGASFPAHYQDLHLYFSYRQDRQQLRSIEIDLK